MELETAPAVPTPAGGRWRRVTESRWWQWLTNDPRYRRAGDGAGDRIDWARAIPFGGLHLGCLLVLEVGASAAAVALAGVLYLARMFFITAFYHRYFAHRAFRASRAVQFGMAVLGCTAGQRGPLWWAGHHREHHVTADTPEDPHSPSHRGMLHSHMGWFLTRDSFAVPEHRVRNWLKFPELRALERVDWLPFVALGGACYALGWSLERAWPALETNGAQMLVWGFFVSTVALYHATYTINSLAHRFGRRPYATRDDSRNNFWLALLTLGEGWHNNHHFYPTSARQGFRWWQVDASYWGLKLLAMLGLVRDLKPVPARVLAAADARRSAAR